MKIDVVISALDVLFEDDTTELPLTLTKREAVIAVSLVYLAFYRGVWIDTTAADIDSLMSTTASLMDKLDNLL